MQIPVLEVDSRIKVRAKPKPQLTGAAGEYRNSASHEGQGSHALHSPERPAPMFTTKVERATQRGYLIYAPYTDDYHSIISIGDEIEIAYPYRGAVYFFESEVLDEAVDQVKLLEISEPMFVRRDQRREFVRVPVYLRIRYACEDESPDAIAPGQWYEALLTDLSGGGAAVFVETLPSGAEEGQCIRLLLPVVRNEDPMDITAQIVRVEDASTPVQRGYSVGIKFIDLPEVQRREIVKFVFERQRMLLRTSLRHDE